jgi:hypothetical protein
MPVIRSGRSAEKKYCCIDALRPPRTVEPAPRHEFVTLDEVLQLAAMKIEGNDLVLRRD